MELIGEDINMYIPENDTILHEVLGAFDFPATLVGAVPDKRHILGDPHFLAKIHL